MTLHHDNLDRGTSVPKIRFKRLVFGFQNGNMSHFLPRSDRCTISISQMDSPSESKEDSARKHTWSYAWQQISVEKQHQSFRVSPGILGSCSSCYNVPSNYTYRPLKNVRIPGATNAACWILRFGWWRLSAALYPLALRKLRDQG